MKYSKIPLAQTVVALCQDKEIAHIVISPGSRNAPLTIGFTENPYFRTFSIVDERCAAFFALGMAQQLQKPVALVCTSGSALLNYYPAVSEAFYSDIPLVVLSADRPIERIDIGDGQTIRQKNIFENHILYSANLYSELVLEEKTDDHGINQKQFESQKHNELEINLALNTAIERQGPVHINIPFYEPLYYTVNRPLTNPTKIAPELEPKRIDTAELEPYADIWNKAKRKMVLVGVNQPNTVEQAYLDILAQDESVVVFTETTSNLHHPGFFAQIDKMIAPLEEEGFKKLQPEILLTFGGMIISKKIKAFLRDYRPKHHWHVDGKKAYDTFFCLNKHFEQTSNGFFKAFLPVTIPVKSDYRSYLNGIRKHRDILHQKYLASIPFSDMKVFGNVLNSIPDNNQLQLGNSSTVRYAQLFDLNKSLSVFCNRGTSGIEGTTSTAIGASLIASHPTTLVTGDLSFFYDSNALWNNYIPDNFRIILINNGGGGIFRILPGNKNTENFDTYFETVHGLTAKQLCEMYGFDYLLADNEEDLAASLSGFHAKSSAPRLLEIKTPSKLNDTILLDYFRFIK